MLLWLVLKTFLVALPENVVTVYKEGFRVPHCSPSVVENTLKLKLNVSQCVGEQRQMNENMCICVTSDRDNC